MNSAQEDRLLGVGIDASTEEGVLAQRLLERIRAASRNEERGTSAIEQSSTKR